MALATTCPQCKTSFKVVPDQLKLRRGLVRCGVCQHVFSGIDYLRYVDEATRAGVQRAPAGGSAPAAPTPAGPAASPASHAAHAPAAPATPPAAAGPALGAPAGRDANAGRDAGAASPRGDRLPLETQPMPSAAHEFESLPTVPHPPAGGPQTVISADDDLKTAFFLTDSGFGPFPGEHPDAVLPTSIQRAAPTPQPAGVSVHGEPVTDRPAGHGRAPALDYTPPFDFVPTSGHAATSGGVPPSEHTPAAGPAAPADHAAPADDASRDAHGPPDDRAPPAARAPASVRPRRDAAQDEHDAVDFFGTARRPRRGLGLALSPAAWSAAGLLTLALVLQAVVGLRNEIAVSAPVLAPPLTAILGLFGVRVGPPRDLAALTIESFELQSSGTPNVLVMSALLRNRAAHAVRWPAMELTLTDSGGALLIRKVIGPEQYLAGGPSTGDTGAAGAAPAALQGGSEWPVRLALEHNGLEPTGYAVALFYP